MPASIYRSPEGRAEILGLYDEALSRLGVGHESNTVIRSRPTTERPTSSPWVPKTPRL